MRPATRPETTAPATKAASEVSVAETEKPARPGRGAAQQHHVAGHVGDEDMAEAEITDRVDHPADQGQQDERREHLRGVFAV